MRGKDQHLWVDIETSGLDPIVNGIVQIAGAIVIDGFTVKTFNYPCRLLSGDKLTKKSTEVHGYTMDDIRKFPPAHDQFITIVKMLREYVDPADTLDKFTMYGYNAVFDYTFLRNWWDKNDSPYFGSYVWFPPIDVMNKAAEELQGVDRTTIRSFKLRTVAKYLGLPIDTKRLHDAQYDIEMTRWVYHKLRGEEYEMFRYESIPF